MMILILFVLTRQGTYSIMPVHSNLFILDAHEINAWVLIRNLYSVLFSCSLYIYLYRISLCCPSSVSLDNETVARSILLPCSGRNSRSCG